jgi:hypothetical protein
MKMDGRSSRDIAKHLGTSTAAVDMVFSRAKRKLYRYLTETDVAGASRPKPAALKSTVPRPSPLHAAVIKSRDGEPTPGT